MRYVIFILFLFVVTACVEPAPNAAKVNEYPSSVTFTEAAANQQQAESDAKITEFEDVIKKCHEADGIFIQDGHYGENVCFRRDAVIFTERH
jgi:hypothetical protein